MKQFLSWFGKKVANAIITAVLFIVVVLGIVYANISWPSGNPGGSETTGGKFTVIFNNILQSGNYITDTTGEVKNSAKLGGFPASDYLLKSDYKCLSKGGTLDATEGCIYTYMNISSALGWARELRNGDGQYLCAKYHPGGTFLSHTTTTHGTSCGGLYGLVYWDGSNFINYQQFGGICGGNVTVESTVTCKIPVN
ncbi:MAG: hypothetical protein PHN60_01010 [Candidatus Gracilibacteria bacterium]|nr:hypothetical protein [Candidatus Gracilibacteria bacterium]